MRRMILLILLLSGCSDFFCGQSYHSERDINKTFSVEQIGIKADCWLYSIKVKKYSQQEKETFNPARDFSTYILSDLTISNHGGKKGKYNLENYSLWIAGATSNEIYIQAPARFILKDEEIAPGETVKKSVYWVFENDMSASDVDQIMMLYREHKVEE